MVNKINEIYYLKFSKVTISFEGICFLIDGEVEEDR